MMAVAAGGCQPKASADGGGATSRPAMRESSREPVRRVEVISKSSADLADSIVGRKCRVQIRRDALGMAGNAPAVMSGRWATESSIDGTILELSDQWLIVQASGKRVVVPHASILVIELQD
jgi:capsid protein